MSTCSPDALAAAAALTEWEDQMETLAPVPATHSTDELLAGAQIAIHYFYHGCELRRFDRAAPSDVTDTSGASAGGAPSVRFE